VVLKVTSMVSDNLLRNPEPSYDLIKNEKCCSFPIIRKCWHSLNPLGEVVDDHDNVTIPPSRSLVACHKIYPPLGERANNNNGKHGSGWMHTHFLSEYLTRVTFLDGLNTIFEYRGPKIPNAQNILGCRQPR
jgi:hypothetical protein